MTQRVSIAVLREEARRRNAPMLRVDIDVAWPSGTRKSLTSFRPNTPEEVLEQVRTLCASLGAVRLREGGADETGTES